MLLPMNIDISENNLVYNRIVEENNNLLFEVVMYNLENGKNNYSFFRPTTYKYCDIYVYDI